MTSISSWKVTELSSQIHNIACTKWKKSTHNLSLIPSVKQLSLPEMLCLPCIWKQKRRYRETEGSVG